MQHYQSSTHFYESIDLVLRADEPLTLSLVAQSMILFISDKSECPKARVSLFHCIGVNRLHIGVSSELESIYIIQLFGHG